MTRLEPRIRPNEAHGNDPETREELRNRSTEAQRIHPERPVRVDAVAVANELAELVTREHRRAADERRRRERAEAAASDLVTLVAHEHRRADEELGRRQKAEATASDLAVLLAHEHAEVERERDARRRAEAELAALLEERQWAEPNVAKRRRFARRG